MKDWRRGKRNKQVSTHITLQDSKILKDFNVSLSGAIEGYIDFVLNQYGLKEQELKKINEEIQEIERKAKQKNKLIERRKEIMEELNYINESGLDLSPKQKGTIEKMVKSYFKNESYYNFEDFIQNNMKNIKPLAFEENITEERFITLLRKEHEKKFYKIKQEKEEKRNSIIGFINVSKDVDDETKLQLYYCIKRGLKMIDKTPNKFPTFEKYLELERRMVESYCSKCDMKYFDFVSLAIEGFENFPKNQKRKIEKS